MWRMVNLQFFFQVPILGMLALKRCVQLRLKGCPMSPGPKSARQFSSKRKVVGCVGVLQTSRATKARSKGKELYHDETWWNMTKHAETWWNYVQPIPTFSYFERKSSIKHFLVKKILKDQDQRYGMPVTMPLGNHGFPRGNNGKIQVKLRFKSRNPDERLIETSVDARWVGVWTVWTWGRRRA